jgi:methionyl-tRNA formyltransferase
MSLQVVFFGNSEGVFSNRHFEALLQSPCGIAGVVDVPPTKRSSTNTGTVEDLSFVEIARQRGIPAFEPVSLNAPGFLNAVRALAPDLFIAVGYLGLLDRETLAVPRRLAVNFHASLLPAYRGKHPIFWALRNAEPLVGLTVHVMEPTFDTGDILYQVRVRTRKTDTVASVYDRVMARSVRLVGRLIAESEAGTLRPKPQTERGASYRSAVREEDLHLDWSRRAEELSRWIRLSPGQCFRDLAGRRVFFGDAEVALCQRRASPGTLLQIDHGSVMIAAGAGALRVCKVRVDRQGERPAPEVFRGLGLREGGLL